MILNCLKCEISRTFLPTLRLFVSSDFRPHGIDLSDCFIFLNLSVWLRSHQQSRRETSTEATRCYLIRKSNSPADIGYFTSIIFSLLTTCSDSIFYKRSRSQFASKLETDRLSFTNVHQVELKKMFYNLSTGLVSHSRVEVGNKSYTVISTYIFLRPVLHSY